MSNHSLSMLDKKTTVYFWTSSAVLVIFLAGILIVRIWDLFFFFWLPLIFWADASSKYFLKKISHYKIDYALLLGIFLFVLFYIFTGWVAKLIGFSGF